MRNYPGLGVMLGMLGGNAETVLAHNGALNKRINGAALDDNVLYLGFDDGSAIRIYDDGQSCCEQRYMTTDDNVADLIGGIFLGCEVKSGPNVPDEGGGEHEIQFLAVKTNTDVITFANHNEHNGYYGGFRIAVKSCAYRSQPWTKAK